MRKTAAMVSNNNPAMPMPEGIPETCRIPEAQNMLHCSYRHVQELMYSGRLKYYKAGERLVLIDLDSLRKLFEVPANSAVLQDSDIM